MGFLATINSIDARISGFIHQLDHKLPSLILYPFTAFFHPGLIWIPYVSILYLSQYDLGFTFLYVIATLICLILTTVLKKVAKRPRPTLNPKMSKPHHFRKKEKNNSMPSGDAFQSAVYVVFLSTFGIHPLALIAFHLAVCIGRVYYMCHWAADTMVSTFLGVFVAKMLLSSELRHTLMAIPDTLLDF